MEKIVEIKHLSKRFKDKQAVDDVSFTIRKGEVVAILGPNGAGKTTTMLMMLGLLNPTNGSALLFSRNAKEKSVRNRIGVMLQEVSLMDCLSVKEILQLFRSYYPVPLSYDELIELTGLEQEELKKRTEKLSGGQKRRVAFALAMAGNPDLLFFDEPTVGMDVSARKHFWQRVRELANQGKTIIFSTHYLQEADDIADRIILFNHGKVIADGRPDEIKNKVAKQSVSFILDPSISRESLSQDPFLSKMYEKDGRIYITTDDTDAVLARIFELKLKAGEIRIEKGRLEEAFEQLTEEREVI
ncbi:ABC transporter ATP-binding protein [Rubeoparvulum massiliense]|uniref:ABC transporter ATP-binding protein n=1 Tax=Rubeoparvulum massiliense TaxID=1631346 RepID=UPI00065E5416|nr:ABC transporter ATP-binding protein [Rubeoparvulum massiliense]